MSVRKVCRGCLSHSNSSTDPFFPLDAVVEETNLKISTMLPSFPEFDAVEKEFPQNLCVDCLQSLIVCHNFMKTYRKSQTTLRQQLIAMRQQTLEQKGKKRKSKPRAKRKKVVKPVKEEDNESDPFEEEEFNLVAQSIELTNAAFSGVEPQEQLTLEEDEPVPEKVVAIERIDADLECPECPQTFSNVSLFGNHLKQHNISVLCSLCNQQFLNGEEYAIHYITYHLYQCGVCERTYKNAEQLEKHRELQICAPDNTFICHVESCGRKYNSKNSLTAHMRSEHGNESDRLLCSLCGHVFKNGHRLKYHLKRHEGPSIACSYCPKKYMSIDGLRMHMWRHTGVKPYQCIKCLTTFSRVSTYRRHMRKKICENYPNEKSSPMVCL